MKIALVGNEYKQQFPLLSYGGIEASVEQLAWGLHRANHDFFCVVPKREKKNDGKAFPFEILEASFVPSSISKRPAMEFALEAANIIRDKKPDVIWSQSHWSIPPLLPLEIPIICTFSDSCAKQAGWMVPHPRVFYRFVSKFQYKLWVQESWEKSCSFAIYNGLDPEEYEFSEQHEDYFLWVGGLNWGWRDKGLDLFLILAQRNPNKRFVAYGTGSNEIEAKLRELNKQMANFEFRGELKRGLEHKRAFQKAKAFLMLTQVPEALGRTVLESLSKGTPVIGSANGALPEIIREHGVSSNDVEELNRALDQAYDNRACFEYSKKFSIENEVKQMVQASERVLKGL
jgi:glycosyltransferase involved in cell wall biosynthesis